MKKSKLTKSSSLKNNTSIMQTESISITESFLSKVLYAALAWNVTDHCWEQCNEKNNFDSKFFRQEKKSEILISSFVKDRFFFTFKALRCGAYCSATLKRGRCSFQINYLKLPPVNRTIANRICDSNLDSDKTHDQTW